jgi:Fic family protein
MDPEKFVASDFGRPGRSPGPQSYCVYLPNPIPRAVRLDERTALQLSEADRALGRLAGAGRLLKTPYYLANLYIRREAVSSTRIEGTQATLGDLYDAETGGAIGADVRDVINYIKAMECGLAAIKDGPITIELVTQLHLVLLESARGEDRRPGVVRDRPN